MRLHVIANSDSDHDQSVKLSVRDAVLEEITAITQGCTSVEEAEAAITKNIDVICEVAQNALCELGEDKAISVTLSEEYYPTRDYDDFSL